MTVELGIAIGVQHRSIALDMNEVIVECIGRGRRHRMPGGAGHMSPA